MAISVWQKCLAQLESELSSQQFETWIRPLQVLAVSGTNSALTLLAPNKYIRDKVHAQFLERIRELANRQGSDRVMLEIGSQFNEAHPSEEGSTNEAGSYCNNGVSDGNRNKDQSQKRPARASKRARDAQTQGFHPLIELNRAFTFDSFVEGRSNQLARAAALQVCENIGSAYNPLLLYGGSGLGKTHLMHAVGNAIKERHPDVTVAYMYSQRFMEDMVRAIERGAMSAFTQYYRSVNVLLMDDIQFLAKGIKSQEEFFHVFNRLQEDGSQIVLTCDRYPKEIEGLEERLKSRFVWGMTAPVEPPELETRVAILMKKAEQEGVPISHDSAFFIAERIRSNVRELEGALKRVI
ncbi:MAG: chromosomal replication initiator protein DnaA, partial [Gammaproteobacteria bacterium]|nr:chromosomal replication initiator protein DnaA [Gammaproteobacteria bacterium]